MFAPTWSRTSTAPTAGLSALGSQPAAIPAFLAPLLRAAPSQASPTLNAYGMAWPAWQPASQPAAQPFIQTAPQSALQLGLQPAMELAMEPAMQQAVVLAGQSGMQQELQWF